MYLGLGGMPLLLLANQVRLEYTRRKVTVPRQRVNA